MRPAPLRRPGALAAAALAAGFVARALAAPQAPAEPPPDPASAINWARARDINARYRTVVDTSGLEAYLALDPMDLEARIVKPLYPGGFLQCQGSG